MASRLSPELLQIIFSEVVDAPRSHFRYEDDVQKRIKDLLSCCLVSRAWRYEAQRVLQEVILITNRAALQDRLTKREAGHASVRQIMVAMKWDGTKKRLMTIHHILDFEMPRLWSLVLREGINLGLDSKNTLRPKELANLSRLRELELYEHGHTGCWQPLLLSMPRLEHLRLCHVGWRKMWVGEHETIALAESPPFNLKSLEIHSSDISLEPLRWLLAKSADTLCRLSVEELQVEWDTLIHLSQMRVEGLLPKVHHLTFYGRTTAHSSYIKHLPRKVTAPLACWGGIESTCIRAEDAKMRAGIINGVAAISPPPVIELDASSMEFHDLKAVFRVRKAKLQPGTILRLITEWCHYYNSAEYWALYAEDAYELAQKNGVTLQFENLPHHTQRSFLMF